MAKLTFKIIICTLLLGCSWSANMHANSGTSPVVQEKPEVKGYEFTVDPQVVARAVTVTAMVVVAIIASRKIMAHASRVMADAHQKALFIDKVIELKRV